jgi:hypothetical protein
MVINTHTLDTSELFFLTEDHKASVEIPNYFEQVLVEA